jgi:hypothetical protein
VAKVASAFTTKLQHAPYFRARKLKRGETLEGRINLGFIHNWIAIGGTAFLAIGVGMLIAKVVAAKSIPLLSSVAMGVINFWNMTVSI